MRPRPLPDSLATGPFSTARARELGLAKARLTRRDLVHPTRGAHSLVAPVSLADRARAWAQGLPPRRAYSHVTAGRLLELPMPRALQALADAGDLHVMSETPDGQINRPGVTGHRGLELRQTEDVSGVQVVALADTWCDLATLGPRLIGVEDLVVIGDHVARVLDERAGAVVRPGSVTSPGVRALHEALGRRVRPRGKVMVRQALELVRPRAGSPMESRARLMFVRAGFPEPLLNAAILDEGGERLAEGDLVWPDRRLIGEYQGAVHGDIKRRSADSARAHLLAEHRWTVEELFAEDVYQRPRRISALRRFADHLGLDPAGLLIA